MTERTLDETVLRSWVGRSERAEDAIDARPARLMQATLDREATLADGDALPPLWHWLYFPTTAPMGALGRDGHPRLGGFLPPVALPRRMWAGGRFTFHAPLRLGETATRLSTIRAVRLKQGRTGALCFVTVGHDFSAGGAQRFSEEHDIVYREDPSPGAPKPQPPAPPQGAVWRRSVTPDPVMLFRYSALTFNGHRIHYDRDYCRDVEGYPGLVFHGPLTATLLVELAQAEAPGRRLVGYEFRAVAPLFDTAPFTLCGRPAADGDDAELWAETPEGGLAMQATARFA